MLKKLSIIFAFLLVYSFSYSTPRESVDTVLKFYKELGQNEFQILKLNKVNKNSKIKLEYDGKIGYCYFGKATPNKDVEIDLILSKNNKYIILASGDNNIKDIDVYIYDAYGNTVAYDRSTLKNSFPQLDDLMYNLETEDDKNNIKDAIESNYSIKPVLHFHPHSNLWF